MPNVAIELPDDILHELEARWQNVPRRVLEAVAAEGYRTGALTNGQVRRTLNLSWHETEAFLKNHQAYLHYNETDLEQDVETLNRLLPIRLA
jgi:predicted HTH domain antitoxin